jgi:hypothetical protein
MTTIAIELTDAEMAALTERAASLGMTPEEWVRSGITQRLTEPFDEAARARKIAEITAKLFEERADVYKALAEGPP